MRSATRSTSPRSWLVSRTVTPSSRSRPRIARVAARPSTSMPAVGSSSATSSGRPTSASASPRRCRSPPDMRRYRVRAACPSSPTSVKQLVRRARVAVERAVEPQHLARRHPRVDPAAALEHQPDPRPVVPRGRRRIGPEDADRSAIGSPVALEDLDRRRLAGAVRPEERERLAAGDPERDAVDDRPAAVALDEPLDLDRRVRRAGRRRLAAGRGVRHEPPAISSYWRSKSASRTSPIWIDRRIPSRSMK